MFKVSVLSCNFEKPITISIAQDKDLRAKLTVKATKRKTRIRWPRMVK